MVKNLNSGIITCTDTYVRYFNDSGKTILGHAIDGIEDGEIKTECQSLVINLENNHTRFKPKIE